MKFNHHKQHGLWPHLPENDGAALGLKPKGYTLDEALSFKEILNEPVISAMGIKKEMIITK